MKKLFQFAAIAACAVAFAACSDDKDEPKLPDADNPTVAEGVFVLNQGNYYSQIEGSLTFIDYAAGKASQNVFQAANGKSLGSTPQCAVVYGSHIYIGVYESNVIQVINRNTFKSEKMISLENAEGQNPRSLVAKDGKVYISMYNGYVSRLDTLSLAIDKTVKVGPNPEIIAIKGNHLYVPNSDGMNWEVGYGTTASKIDLATFQVVETMTVGLNPCEFASNGTDLFLLCKGDYYLVPSMVYKVEDNGSLKEIGNATYITVNGDKLYYIDSPYGAEKIYYTVYDVKTGKTSEMLADEGVDSPAAIGVDPINGNIVITSNKIENGWVNYNADGYVKIYDAAGKYMSRYDVGLSPSAIFFNYK